ncbi:Calcineurin B homologou protein 1 [Taenia crassiceps]|uniref:Calcineurin B homologou protein 1 n=1 Tax=Taenia crassiceps TaxID=6207 RepID=A0ABR4QEA7_9CEST
MGGGSSKILDPEEFLRNKYIDSTTVIPHSIGPRRQDFLLIPELAINPLGDRIINEFFKGGEELNFREFMQKVARFRKPNSSGVTEYNNREAKLRFLFGMYDLDVDNRISRSELLSVLQMMVGASVTMEQINRIGERTMAEADVDGDGYITYDEFKAAVEGVWYPLDVTADGRRLQHSRLQKN